MKKDVPVLDLKTIEEFLPGWHEEMRRVGSIGRPTERVVFGRICCKTKPVPAKGQQAKDFAYFFLKSHFAAIDSLTKLVLLEEYIAAYVKKFKTYPSNEDENEIRELLGLGPAIGSA